MSIKSKIEVSIDEIKKIRNPVTLGIYCYIRFYEPGTWMIKDIHEHFKLPARHIESSLEWLRDEGLI